MMVPTSQPSHSTLFPSCPQRSCPKNSGGGRWGSGWVPLTLSHVVSCSLKLTGKADGAGCPLTTTSPGLGPETQASEASMPSGESSQSHSRLGLPAQLTSAPLPGSTQSLGHPVCPWPRATRAKSHVTFSPTASGKLKLKRLPLLVVQKGKPWTLPDRNGGAGKTLGPSPPWRRRTISFQPLSGPAGPAGVIPVFPRVTLNAQAGWPATPRTGALALLWVWRDEATQGKTSQLSGLPHRQLGPEV